MIKVPSVIQILLAELLCVWGVTSLVIGAWNTVRPGSFGESATLRGIGNWVWFLLGLALLVWLLREIFQPRVKRDSWVSFKTGASSGGSYGFCSTHPSYCFLDLVVVTVSAFMLWYARGAGVESKQYSVMLGLALLFPAARLFAWYGLGLRIKERTETATAWKPAVAVAGCFFLIFAVIGVMVAVGEVQHRREIANMPVVDEQSFRNSREAFARLADEKRQETGYVRLRATQLSDAAQQCRNNQNFDFATVHASLGAGGDVLIVGSKYDRSGFDELVGKSGGNKGRQIEVVGKLRELPATSALEKWKAYCGVDQLPPAPEGGRWVLEMHEP